MGFIKKFMAGTYEVKMRCLNCNSKVIIKIPKGITIKEFLEDKKALCNYCGCDTMEFNENGNNRTQQ
jgi:DNA-directed RNA polymerase subunit RPC12/RpoP